MIVVNNILAKECSGLRVINVNREMPSRNVIINVAFNVPSIELLGSNDQFLRIILTQKKATKNFMF